MWREIYQEFDLEDDSYKDLTMTEKRTRTGDTKWLGGGYDIISRENIPQYKIEQKIKDRQTYRDEEAMSLYQARRVLQERLDGKIMKDDFEIGGAL